MNNLKVVIVSGGNEPSEKLLRSYLKDADFLIAADKGIECLYNYNIIPNLLLGDFDSAKKEVLSYMQAQVKETLEFPPEKDYTDTEIALIEAINRGGNKIYLFGALGSRMDHTLGNVGLLLKAKRSGAILEIIDDNNRLYLAKKNMTLLGKPGDNISFHALSDTVINLWIKGAKYKLEGYDMNLLDPRAICNEFIDGPVELSYEEGELLILHSID